MARGLASFVFLIAASATVPTAAIAERIALSDSTVTFEVPAGPWKSQAVPAAEKPLVSLALCVESGPEDACTARAELSIGEMTDEQKPASLKELVEQWHGPLGDVTIVGARTIELSGRPAVERVSLAEYPDDSHRQVYYDMVVLQAGDTYYACVMTMNPPDFFALGSVVRDACASLHTAASHSG